MSPLRLPYPTGMLLGFSIGAGCLTPLPNHCSELEGDQTCGQGRFCSCSLDGDGCVDTKPPDDCHFPGPHGPGSTSGAESPHEQSTETSHSTAGTSHDSPEPECESNDHCADAATPFCEPSTGKCVPCDAMPDPDAACEALSSGAPLCAAGSCVQCTPEEPAVCDQSRRVCDAGSNTCVPCTEHEQCSSGACELALEGGGLCFPLDTPVVEIHEGELSAAVTGVPSGGYGIFMVHPGPYAESVHVEGKTIALFAVSDRPELDGAATGTAPGLRVEGPGTALYVDGLEVSTTEDAALGVEVDQAMAWFDRSRIVMNSGGGILATNGARLTLRNCFVGGSVNETHALEVVDSTASVLYTTLGAGFGANPGDATALSCSGQASAEVRNSLLVAFNTTENVDEVRCPNADIEHSVSVHDIEGTSNIALHAMESSWFEGYNIGDFHLSSIAPHPIEIDTAAQWRAGDPLDDIDGQPRPTVPNATDFAGADRR